MPSEIAFLHGVLDRVPSEIAFPLDRVPSEIAFVVAARVAPTRARHHAGTQAVHCIVNMWSKENVLMNTLYPSDHLESLLFLTEHY